jgi:hypothetical protein
MSKQSKGPKDDYVVGYGRPPAHTQFQKGNPGPRKGRRKPKKTLSLDDVVRTLLDQKVRVKSGNETISVDMKKILVTRLTSMLTNGNARDMKFVLELLKDHAPQELEQATLDIVYHRASGSDLRAPADADGTDADKDSE